MKKQSNALILAALVLGLVCAPLALARDPSSPTFHIINSTGSSITVECSGNPPRPTILSGSTDTLTCNATVVVKMKSQNAAYIYETNFSFECESGQIQETTVTFAPEALSVAHSCTDPSTEESTEESSTEESSEE